MTVKPTARVIPFLFFQVSCYAVSIFIFSGKLLFLKIGK